MSNPLRHAGRMKIKILVRLQVSILNFFRVHDHQTIALFGSFRFVKNLTDALRCLARFGFSDDIFCPIVLSDVLQRVNR